MDPNYAAASNNLALVYAREGKIRESLELFKRHVTEAQAYANVGVLLAKSGDTARGEQMMLRRDA